MGTAMREAESAFGDDTVFLERAVIDPRHIEVQVLADHTGAAVHLFERDCSVQRRHQKVIEVAPAVNLDPEIRAAMCADAVAFARHIGYRNAGTVEFLLRHARAPRIHRDEPADPGRAHRHRGDHRRRPGVLADPDRSGRDAGRSRPGAGEHPGARGGAAVPDHHRGPDQRLPAGYRPDHHLSLARRWWGAGGRRHRALRRRGQRPLRFAAGQADLPRPGLVAGGRQSPTGARGVPDSRCGHQHPVPAGSARRSGLRGRRSHHLLHRDPPAVVDRAPLRRPRHPVAHLPGRRDGQSTQRTASRPT